MFASDISKDFQRFSRISFELEYYCENNKLIDYFKQYKSINLYNANMGKYVADIRINP